MTNHSRPERVLLAHGDGGRMTHELVTGLFLPSYGNAVLERLGDSAHLPLPRNGEWGRMAFTTDSFVVKPLFFPGGNIGKLAVFGTINDLAVSGARPLFLSASFIAAEGLSMGLLRRVAQSMGQAALRAKVAIVAGDTKVVAKGDADGLFITTAGIGMVRPGLELEARRVKPGDRVLVSGPVGEHGITVILARQGLAVGGALRSDCAPIHGLTEPLVARFDGVKFMRDPTRGGLATALCELAGEAGVDIVVDESLIPVPSPVRAACDMLGLDPLYLANEGKFAAVVSPSQADAAVAFLGKRRGGREACIIGRVEEGRGSVLLRTALGGTRRLEMLAGEPLPRIC
ncbi:MAG: hydrogenase expression/formation protein HypE [Firmicutes bacterium]|nr:hydrogenase expression/formation protein HypE [Bacillota bacterium]